MSAAPTASGARPLWIVGLAVALFAAAGTYRPDDDPDLYWHLKVGEWIVEHREVPRVDTFSYTFAGRPFPLVDWGSQVAMATLHAHFGVGGLFAMAASLAALALLLAAARMRQPDTPPSTTLAAIILLLIYATAAFRFTPRPQTFLFAFLGVLLLLCERAVARRSLRPLWGVPPLVVLWANVHASSFIAPVLLGALGAGSLIDLRGRWREVLRQHGRALSALAAATLLAGFVAPNPLGRLKVTLGVLSLPYTARVTSEWQAPLASVWLGPAGALLALFVLAGVLGRRRLAAHEVTLAAASCWLAFRSVRFLPVMAVVAGPICYRLLAGALDARLRRAAAGRNGDLARRWRRADWLMATAVLGTAAGVAFGLDAPTPWLGWARRPNAELAGASYPVGATRFLARERPRGNMYNTFHFGGYLMYHLGPGVKVFVDGRTTNVYDDAHMYDVMHIRSVWPRVFARWNVEYAVTQPGELEEPLAADPHWNLVFFDDAAFVFVRNDGVDAELARRLGYHELLPPFRSAGAHTPERLARLDAEAARAVAEAPRSALAHILSGRVRALHGDVGGLEREMSAAIALDPTRPEPWQRLGLVALGRGRFAEAARELGRALDLRPDSTDVRMMLAAAQVGAGDTERARQTLHPLATGGRTVDELLADAARSPLLGPRPPPPGPH